MAAHPPATAGGTDRIQQWAGVPSWIEV